MRIVCCAGLNLNPRAPDHLGLKQGLEALGFDWLVVDPITGGPLPKDVADEINDFNPDLVIHGNTDSLTDKIPQLIRGSSVQVFSMFDYRLPDMVPELWETWLTQAPYLSAITVSSGDHIEPWEKAFGVTTFFWPHGCWINPSGLCNFWKLWTRVKRWDQYCYPILFTGVRHTSGPFLARTRLLEQIDSELTKRGLPNISYVNETEIDKRNQVWADLPYYYHLSHVVLDVAHFWGSLGYTSGRYWYSATLGGAAVTKWFPGCEGFFKDDTHKLYFFTPEEAVDSIQFLLENSDERAALKIRAAEWAWTHHNYKIRFDELFRDLNAIGVFDKKRKAGGKVLK